VSASLATIISQIIDKKFSKSTMQMLTPNSQLHQPQIQIHTFTDVSFLIVSLLTSTFNPTKLASFKFFYK